MNPKPTRRQRDRERHKSEIVDAAAGLFHEKGFFSVSVQEIARAAEFGIGTLYRLFPDGKDGVFREMQERVVRAFELELEKVSPGELNEIETIRGYIAAAGRVYEAHPREMSVYMKYIAGVGLDLSKGLPKDLSERYLACVGVLSGAIRSGITKGVFREMNPAAATLSLRAVINTWFVGRMEGYWRESFDESVDRILEFFLSGVEKSRDE